MKKNLVLRSGILQEIVVINIFEKHMQTILVKLLILVLVQVLSIVRNHIKHVNISIMKKIIMKQMINDGILMEIIIPNIFEKHMQMIMVKLLILVLVQAISIVIKSLKFVNILKEKIS